MNETLWNWFDDRLSWSERYVAWREKSITHAVFREFGPRHKAGATEEERRALHHEETEAIEIGLAYLRWSVESRLRDKARRLNLEITHVPGDDFGGHKTARAIQMAIREEERARAAAWKAKLEPWHMLIQIVNVVVGIAGGLILGWLSWGRR